MTGSTAVVSEFLLAVATIVGPSPSWEHSDSVSGTQRRWASMVASQRWMRMSYQTQTGRAALCTRQY